MDWTASILLAVQSMSFRLLTVAAGYSLIFRIAEMIAQRLIAKPATVAE